MTTALQSVGDRQPLELLYEAPRRSGFSLIGELATAYGGPLGFKTPRLYANFVASVSALSQYRTSFSRAT